jgi:hypothetical protein
MSDILQSLETDPVLAKALQAGHGFVPTLVQAAARFVQTAQRRITAG